mmetsp:Transcript_100110/g.182653  ORF Transcript_100110/g.182653 Transcript_100110/m.182653 type:complete len:86 (+) Transcript_100110:1-258(+)
MTGIPVIFVIIVVLMRIIAGDGGGDCTSPDGRGGRDCWICPGEEMSCRDGGTGILTGVRQSGGEYCLQVQEYRCEKKQQKKQKVR